LFAEASWQYVLYGMGYKTDLSPRAGTLRYYDQARAAFAEVRRQAEFACRTLPSNRELIQLAGSRSFGPPSPR
jgi:tryptophan halogenase